MVVAGSKKRGPQVVTASLPPGRTACQSARTAAGISGDEENAKHADNCIELCVAKLHIKQVANLKFRIRQAAPDRLMT
jgi:hypothetical protein